MPMKPIKWGIKLWVLCDERTGYCLAQPPLRPLAGREIIKNMKSMDVLKMSLLLGTVNCPNFGLERNFLGEESARQGARLSLRTRRCRRKRLWPSSSMSSPSGATQGGFETKMMVRNFLDTKGEVSAVFPNNLLGDR